MVALVGELAQHRVHLVDAGRVEVGGRFVEHQHGGGERERAGDRESLPSAAGEHVGVVGAPVPEADELEGALGAFEDLGGRDQAVLGTERDLVEQGAGDDLRVGVLEDHRDVLAEFGDRAVTGVGSRDPHRALEDGGDRVRHEAVERERERRLAAAGGAEHEHHLARADVEGDAVGRGASRPVVPDAHGIELEQRSGGHGRIPDRGRRAPVGGGIADVVGLGQPNLRAHRRGTTG